MAYTEQEGVAAIKYLQGLADIPETDEQAKAGWNSFSEHQKEFTMNFYRDMLANSKPTEIAQEMIAKSPDAQRRRDNDLRRPKTPQRTPPD